MLGWLAIVFGTFDLMSVFEKKPAAMKKALLHGCINTTVVSVYTVLAYLQYRHYPLLRPDSILIVKAATIGCMIAGNFIGGSLILKHKVAVENE